MNKTSIILSLIIVVILAGIIYVFYLAATHKPEQSVIENTPTPSPNNNLNNSNTSMIQGMKVEILKQGTGEGAKTGDNVVVNYVGTLPDGTKFDSSVDRNQPFPLTLGVTSVIQGWQLGLVGMKVGEKRKLTIPPELAYGAQSPSPLIPANSTLVFEIDMLSINGK